MESKPIIFLGMFVGGTVGGFVPMIWGDTGFSMSGIIFNAIGAVVGIYITYRIVNN